MRAKALIACGAIALLAVGGGCRQILGIDDLTPAGGTEGPTFESCKQLAPTCGVAADTSCCAVESIEGGMFYRRFDATPTGTADYPATVNHFRLDKYEVTLGRFRAFVDAGGGQTANAPAAGAGAHALAPNSGWDPAWNVWLGDTRAQVEQRIRLGSCGSLSLWTTTAGAMEERALNCVTWYLAFAFCIREGGYLPTAAELNYAASGGSEHRVYPWSTPPSSPTIDNTYAVYNTSMSTVVGSKSPQGDGKWLHVDLAGNLSEWLLDWAVAFPTTPCDNCADTEPNNAETRAFFSSSYILTSVKIASSFNAGAGPEGGDRSLGFRCAYPQ